MRDRFKRWNDRLDALVRRHTITLCWINLAIQSVTCLSFSHSYGETGRPLHAVVATLSFLVAMIAAFAIYAERKNADHGA